MEDKEEEELLNLSLTIVTDSNGADMNMKRKRSREDHVLNPLMNSYEGCSEGKIYRLLRMREQMIKLDDKKKAVVEDFGKRLHLIHLLRITSTEADESNVGSALENLKELYQSVSLIGANTPEFRVISTPAAKEHARVLRKRKCLFDDVVVFPNKVDNIPVQSNSVLKQCIEDTGDLVSKRRKLPHTAFAVWKACRFSNLDKCYLESLIPYSREVKCVPDLLPLVDLLKLWNVPGKLDIAESPTAGGCLEQLAIAPKTPIQVHNIARGLLRALKDSIFMMKMDRVLKPLRKKFVVTSDQELDLNLLNEVKQ
ncbi:hypothetical protein OIU77_019543 [Salix suchowensis]|uniref:Uncharacterized protein n=1 Tax=Salix suchowensis TaxID=1278906 RepID=A0ABQ9CGD7_9ROSI|nr:hypothetical protein OIU77_019543 [Salix suchowensis]